MIIHGDVSINQNRKAILRMFLGMTGSAVSQELDLNNNDFVEKAY